MSYGSQRLGRRARAFLAALALIVPGAAGANTQGDTQRFEQAHEVAGVTLQRVNTALYRYLFFDVYAAALYLAPGAGTAMALDDGVARRLEVVYLRDGKRGSFRYRLPE